MAIRGERIAAVGTTAEIRALAGVTAAIRVIELGGRVVIIEVAYTTREPLLLHAVGDATIEAILTAMEKQAPAQQWRERRVRVEHGDLFTPTQIVRAAALGVIVVQNPAHLLLPEILSKRLGDCWRDMPAR